MWVSPFGNLWINAYLQLPTAYRSLSRPSSAPDAKAFTLRSCSLELLVYFLYLVLFELSEFLEHFRSGFLLTLVRREKAIYSPFALCFELRFRAALTRLPPFGEIVCTRSRVPFPFGWKD